MKTPYLMFATATLVLLTRASLAAEDELRVPVLEWSFYILLGFALIVGIGIFFKRGNGKSQPLSSLLDEEQASIHAVGPDVSVTECVRRMNEQKIGAMLVMDDQRLLGIFTERDALTKVLGAGLEPTTTSVAKIMTTDPTCVSPATTMDEAMTIVTHQRVRHLPVVQEGKVLGMISSGDLTHWLVKDKSGEVRELVDIAGRRRDSR